MFTLTEAGRAYVQSNADTLRAPWDTVTGGVTDAMQESMALMRDIGFAAMQVLRSGDDTAVEQARAVLADTRRRLYLVLAGEQPAAAGSGTSGEAGSGAEPGATAESGTPAEPGTPEPPA